MTTTYTTPLHESEEMGGVGFELAACLLENALAMVLDDLPVQAADEALPIHTVEPLTRTHAGNFMLNILLELLGSPDTQTCPAERRAALVRTVHRVVCPGCFPPKQLRAVIRHALRPTGFSRAQFAAEPERNLRATALLCAAALGQYEDPEGMLEYLLLVLV